MLISLLILVVLLKACHPVPSPMGPSGSGNIPPYRGGHRHGQPLPAGPLEMVRTWFWLPGDELTRGPVLEDRLPCPRFRPPHNLASPSRRHAPNNIHQMYCMMVRADLRVYHERGMTAAMNLDTWRAERRHITDGFITRISRLSVEVLGHLGSFVITLDPRSDLATIELRARTETIASAFLANHPFVDLETFNIQ